MNYFPSLNSFETKKTVLLSHLLPKRSENTVHGAVQLWPPQTLATLTVAYNRQELQLRGNLKNLQRDVYWGVGGRVNQCYKESTSLNFYGTNTTTKGSPNSDIGQVQSILSLKWICGIKWEWSSLSANKEVKRSAKEQVPSLIRYVLRQKLFLQGRNIM
jgi:hypothetical protein